MTSISDRPIRRRPRRRLARPAFLYALAAVWLLVVLFPFLWFLRLSFMPAGLAFHSPPVLLFTPTGENFAALVDGSSRSDFGKYFFNSIVVAVGTVLLSMSLGTPAAYAILRSGRHHRWLRPAFGATLVIRMLPGLTYVIPFFLLYRALGLMNTQLGLVILYSVFSVSLVIWSMHTFFGEIPVSLEEAARVDGASVVQVFTRIVLPLSGPGLAATAILVFLASWNEFLIALIFGGLDARTAPVAIVNFMAYEGTEWGRIAAACIIVILPVLVFSFVVRRYLVRGLVAGAEIG